MRLQNFMLGVMVMLAGCATMVKGTSQQISLDTPGYPGAECTLRSKDFGTRKVVTPANFELPKSKYDIAVECRKGCARGSGTIASNLEGMTAGNIVAGGVVGFGVDAATGAMNKYNENNQIAMSQGASC